MSRVRRAVPIMTLIVLSIALFPGCAVVFYQKPLHGTVVAAESGQPIEGAVIIACWKPLRVMPGHIGHMAPRHVVEEVTDAEGKYRLPSWGPVLQWPFARIDTPPSIVVFKSGYEPRRNVDVRDPDTGEYHEDDWNGATISLTPYRGTAERRLDSLERVADTCPSEKMFLPFLKELSKEKAALGPLPRQWPFRDLPSEGAQGETK